MAVAPKTTKFRDNRSQAPFTDVHHISVNNGNKKGAAAAIGGELVWNDKEESWHIKFPTVVNGKKVIRLVFNNQIVFTTGKNKRWQVLSKPDFNKRFSVI